MPYVPETSEAILMCEGTCRLPTRHIFSHRAERKSEIGPELVESGEAKTFNMVFACIGCGRTRVWGNERKGDVAA